MRLFHGQRAWVLQRLTALIVLLLLALTAATLLVGPPLNYERWQALATSAPGAVLIVIFFAALCGHAWVGVRDIVLDYIQPTALRLPLLALIALVLIAITIRVTLTMATHFTVGA